MLDCFLKLVHNDMAKKSCACLKILNTKVTMIYGIRPNANEEYVHK